MDITKTSRSAETKILKQGQTTNGSFGSDPNVKVKGGRPTRDISNPVSKR